MPPQAQRRRRQSPARRRSQQKATGFETTTLNVPEGLSFFDGTPGVHTVDIIAYTAGPGNEWADEGTEYYERTFYHYWSLGANEKNYVALGKTFNKPDPVQEYRKQLMADEDADPEAAKALLPKQRQIFLVFDHKDGKLKLWENSFHLFGKLLDERIKTSDEADGWDFFYLLGGPDDPEEDRGMSLRLTIKEKDGGGFTFNEVIAIDFKPRTKALPDAVKNHGHCLDKMLIEVPYDTMKAILFHEEIPVADTPSTAAEPAQKPATKPNPVATESQPKPKPKPKPDAEGPPTCESAGIILHSEVILKKNGEQMKVISISKDGTSMVLQAAEGEVETAIGVNDVVVLPGNQSESEPEIPDDEVPFEPTTESAAASVVETQDVTPDASDEEWEWPDD